MCSYKYRFLQSSSLRQGSTGVDVYHTVHTHTAHTHTHTTHTHTHTVRTHTPYTPWTRAHAHRARARAHGGPPRPYPSQRLAGRWWQPLVEEPPPCSASAERSDDSAWECGINFLPRLETAGPDVYSAASLQSRRHSTPAESSSGNNVFICSGGCEHTHKVLSIQRSTFS